MRKDLWCLDKTVKNTSRLTNFNIKTNITRRGCRKYWTCGRNCIYYQAEPGDANLFFFVLHIRANRGRAPGAPPLNPRLITAEWAVLFSLRLLWLSRLWNLNKVMLTSEAIYMYMILITHPFHLKSKFKCLCYRLFPFKHVFFIQF